MSFSESLACIKLVSQCFTVQIDMDTLTAEVNNSLRANTHFTARAVCFTAAILVRIIHEVHLTAIY